MDELNDYKNELRRLEGKQTEAAPASTSTAGMFDKFLEEDKRRDLYAEEVARIAEINRREKACPVCYRRQPDEHETCRLCREKPERWLPSVPPPLRFDAQANVLDDSGAIIASGLFAGAMRQARDHDHWLRWAATSATVDELKYVVERFSGPTDGWKIKHAAKILLLLGETVPLDFYGRPVDAGALPKKAQAPSPDESIRVTREQVQLALQAYDEQLKQIAAEREELRRQDGTL